MPKFKKKMYHLVSSGLKAVNFKKIAEKKTLILLNN
jgi:hypothetical protein